HVGRLTQPAGSWVGTTIEHVDEHHQQVTLKTGELVYIESEKSVTSKSGNERKWLKIAPPAGEYRWIHLRDVARQKPIDPPSASDENSFIADSSEKKAEPRRIEVPASTIALRDLRQQNSKFDPNVEPAQYRRATGSVDGSGSSPDGFVARKRRDSDQGSSGGPIVSSPASANVRTRLDPTDRIASSSGNVPSTQSAPPATFRGNLSNEEISRQLDQIE